MKKLLDKIDRFCYTHPGFGIPKLMLLIVAGNIAVYLFTAMDTTGALRSMLQFSPEMIFKHGQVWRLLTFVFIPESSGLALLLWLYFYYFIGNELENHWGTAKFNVFYLTGVVLNIIYGVLIWVITGISTPVSIHYVNLSMFFAFATLYPDMQVLFMFILPIKIKWLAIADAALFVFGLLTSPFPLNLLPLVALLNYFIFFADGISDLFGRERRQQRKTTIHFKNEARRINHEMKSKPYTRKCEVCGRTDTDFPDLEFRYCSRCQGYHCYCVDHISNHVHKSE